MVWRLSGCTPKPRGSFALEMGNRSEVYLGVFTLDVPSVLILLSIKTLKRLGVEHHHICFRRVDSQMCIPLTESRSGHLLLDLTSDWMHQARSMAARASGPRPSVLSQLASQYMPGPALSQLVSATESELPSVAVCHGDGDVADGAMQLSLNYTDAGQNHTSVQMFDMTVSDEAFEAQTMQPKDHSQTIALDGGLLGTIHSTSEGGHFRQGQGEGDCKGQDQDRVRHWKSSGARSQSWSALLWPPYPYEARPGVKRPHSLGSVREVPPPHPLHARSFGAHAHFRQAGLLLADTAAAVRIVEERVKSGQDREEGLGCEEHCLSGGRGQSSPATRPCEGAEGEGEREDQGSDLAS